MRLFNPTGGLVYHLRARRYADSLWVPFRNQISQFLDDWHPSEKELLILGPSGGYTLPSDFLERFDRVWMMDPDRLAPYFFNKNHRDLQTEIEWSREDLIFERNRFAPEKLKNWLTGKEVALLFSNILGQLPLLADSEQAHHPEASSHHPEASSHHPEASPPEAQPKDLTDWWKALSTTLGQHSWLSYHDVFSFKEYAALPARLPQGPIVPQLVEWAIQKQKPLELIDHGTAEIFPESQLNWTWNFSPKRTHIVGGAKSEH